MALRCITRAALGEADQVASRETVQVAGIATARRGPGFGGRALPVVISGLEGRGEDDGANPPRGVSKSCGPGLRAFRAFCSR